MPSAQETASASQAFSNLFAGKSSAPAPTSQTTSGAINSTPAFAGGYVDSFGNTLSSPGAARDSMAPSFSTWQQPQQQTPQQNLQGFQLAQQSQLPPPQDAGVAASAVQQFNQAAASKPTFYQPDPNSPQILNAKGEKLSYEAYKAQGGIGEMGKPNWTDVVKGSPPVPNATPLQGIEAQLAADPGYQQLLKDYQQFNNIQEQNKSLVDEYQQIVKSSGLEQINTELINMKNVIDGTEDDIRNEVKAADGFATDSQVLALSQARNKTLIKQYNKLVDQQTAIKDQVNTMINLASQDRQFAMQSISQKLQIDQQIMDYRDKFVANAREGYNNYIKAVGYDGLYQSLKNDPHSLGLAEQTLGLPSGTIAQAALKEQAALAKQNQMDALDMNLKQAQISNIYSEIAKRNQPDPNGLDVQGLVAYAQQYASTGQIPAGLPKGTFGAVAEVAKTLPKSNGTLVDKNTGVRPQGNDAKIAAYADLYSAIDLSKQLKDLDAKRTRGVFGWFKGSKDSDNKRYDDLRTQITDLLARARTGAAMSANEEAFYTKMLPRGISNPLGFGANTQSSIQNLTDNLTRDLNNKLNAQGYAIYGFSQVKMPDGNQYKVGDIVSNGTQQARVNADGTLSLLGE